MKKWLESLKNLHYVKSVWKYVIKTKYDKRCISKKIKKRKISYLRHQADKKQHVNKCGNKQPYERAHGIKCKYMLSCQSFASYFRQFPFGFRGKMLYSPWICGLFAHTTLTNCLKHFRFKLNFYVFCFYFCLKLID